MPALLCCCVVEQLPCNELSFISLVYTNAELLSAENRKRFVCWVLSSPHSHVQLLEFQACKDGLWDKVQLTVWKDCLVVKLLDIMQHIRLFALSVSWAFSCRLDVKAFGLFAFISNKFFVCFLFGYSWRQGSCWHPYLFNQVNNSEGRSVHSDW